MSSNKNLSAVVASKIENQIICGKWTIGSKIPTEQELMVTFDVSRITIREAIKILVSKDILEIHRGCGTFVHIMPGLSEDPLGLRFINDKDLILHLFEARLTMEPTICRLAALRADEEEIELLKQLADELDALDLQLYKEDIAPSVIQAITAKDIAFHTLLCRMSKNPVFDRMLPIVIKSVRTSYSLLIPRIQSASHVSTHQLIYQAIANRDGEEAYRLTAVHLENSFKGFNNKNKDLSAKEALLKNNL